MSEIRVRGARDPGLEAAPVDLGDLDRLGASATVLGAARSGRGRDPGRPVAIEDVGPDSVVEIQFEGGVRLWTSYERLSARAVRGQLRGAVATPGVLELDQVFVPLGVRGEAGTAPIDAVRVFDLDLGRVVEIAKEIAAELGETLDVAALAGEVAGEAAGPWLSWLFDRLRMKHPGLGSWRGPDEPVALPAKIEGAEPCLVFLHGTASSTIGSFGALQQQRMWRRITDRFGERIFALEHRTLGDSPLDNAIQLLEALPGGARLHLVSHSRGGLVGELLAYGQRQRRAGEPLIEKAFIEQLKRRLEADAGRLRRISNKLATVVGERSHREIDRLERLIELLEDRQPRIKRFVRVACPAAGTTLASGRLDEWLSLITNLLDITGLGAFPAYRATKGFLLAAIKTRMDPAAVPGLAAMVPGSAVARLVNRRDVITAADLTVVAGDVKPSGILRRLLVLAADAFYRRDHDFVVDTASMYGGLPRAEPAIAAFESGADVTHFSYFSRASAAARLADGLLRKVRDNKDTELPAGFKVLEPPPELADMLATARAARALRPDRPLVYLLPGLMGSHLEHDEKLRRDRIWLDPFDLALGRLGLLDPREERPILPEAPLSLFYGALAAELEQTHEVVVFPFDWRLSLRREGARLAEDLGRRLRDRAQVPVRLIAHSMGGLVVQSAFGQKPDLWATFAARRGARVLFVGTPWEGSLHVLRGLLAQESTIRYLELIDLTRDVAAIVDIVARFNGFLEMLPSAAAELFTEAGWRPLVEAQKKVGEPIGVPASADLDAAARTRQLLASAPVDRERMVYVTGVAPLTVSAYRVAPEGGVAFSASHRGDGAVLWETIPPQLTTYWIDAQHGDLCRTKSAFAGLVELLERGTTNRLPGAPPAATRAPTAPVPLPPDHPVVQPDLEELAAAAVGGTRPEWEADAAPIEVRVRHENVLFADLPVIVGHYHGDILEGAERVLDEALGGRLTDRRLLNLYPGPIGTADVVLDGADGRVGAIVVGLGEFGDLDPRKLRQSLAAGLKKYALAMREMRPGAAADGLQVATLLVGSGEGGVTIWDAVQALLLAADDTQRALEAMAADRDDDVLPARFTRLDILELWEDRAIQAVDALLGIGQSRHFETPFAPDDQVRSGLAGGRRIAVAPFDEWRRRLVVTEEPDNEVLRFVAPAERARVEELLVPGNRVVVDRFIERAVERRDFVETGDNPGVTLFELLIPNRLKGLGLGERGLVLILDEAAARYPWELMFDRSQGADEPISVRAGMIRQLRALAAPETQPVAAEERALVVGDPITGTPLFPQLSGAEREAAQVRDRLRVGGFDVIALIGEAAPERILGKLYADPYRIVHLAAHGVFEWMPAKDAEFGPPDGNKERKPLTGMVLGGGLLLTPELISQMPTAPELVFLNCCFLGQAKPEAEAKARGEPGQPAARHLPQLAANLATQFIRLGSRAVVAAGWAVDDAAAQLFADRFYGQMLDGCTFFDAIKAARRTAFDAYRHVNTWGAYQCYGDPNYRLPRRAAGRPEGAGPIEAPVRLPRTREQVRLELTNIAQDAQVRQDADEAKLGARIDAALEALGRRGWEQDPVLATAAARALGEIGRLSDAIALYQTALQADKAETPVRSLEQLANFRARFAAERARDGGDPDDPGKAETEIAGAIGQLTDLVALAGETRERLSLLAACHKRLALVRSGEARRQALADMADHYARAAGEIPSGRGRPAEPARPYPLLNWLTGRLLLSLRWGERRPDRFEARVGAARAAAEAADQDFWNLVMVVDADLLAAMAVAGGLAERAGAASFVQRYAEAARRASALHFRSVLEHLEFMTEMLADAEEARTTAAALHSLRTRLQQQMRLS